MSITTPAAYPYLFPGQARSSATPAVDYAPHHHRVDRVQEMCARMGVLRQGIERPDQRRVRATAHLMLMVLLVVVNYTTLPLSHRRLAAPFPCTKSSRALCAALVWFMVGRAATRAQRSLVASWSISPTSCRCIVVASKLADALLATEACRRSRCGATRPTLHGHRVVGTTSLRGCSSSAIFDCGEGIR